MFASFSLLQLASLPNSGGRAWPWAESKVLFHKISCSQAVRAVRRPVAPSAQRIPDPHDVPGRGLAALFHGEGDAVGEVAAFAVLVPGDGTLGLTTAARVDAAGESGATDAGPGGPDVGNGVVGIVIAEAGDPDALDRMGVGLGADAVVVGELAGLALRVAAGTGRGEALTRVAGGEAVAAGPVTVVVTVLESDGAGRNTTYAARVMANIVVRSAVDLRGRPWGKRITLP